MSCTIEAFARHQLVTGQVSCQNGFRAQSSTDLLEPWYIAASRIIHFVASFFWGDGISDTEINSIHSSLKGAETALYARKDLAEGENYYSKGKAITGLHFSKEKSMASQYSNAVKKINALQAKTGHSVEYILALVIPDNTNSHQKVRDYQLLAAFNDPDNMTNKKSKVW